MFQNHIYHNNIFTFFLLFFMPIKSAFEMLKGVNGSRNILYLMKEWIQHRKRPTIFCRKPLIISQDE